MKIVVLAGGLSPERDVSLSSGSLIANALIENGHQVALIDLYLGTGNIETEKLFYDKSGGMVFTYRVPEEEPDLAALAEAYPNGGARIGSGVLTACRQADLVFIALHGAEGENGQIQAVFDLSGICYTGSGYSACVLAMDKDLSKQLMERRNIRTPAWKKISRAEELYAAAQELGFPLVVKPCGCGSSVGVAMVEGKEDLEKAFSEAAKYENSILLERKVSGREFSVGILEGSALPPIEIIPKAGFYDYKNKYQSGLTEEICPALLPEADIREMQRLASEIHEMMGLGSYSRSDFILNEDGYCYCLEVNTLPGMTPTSLLPQEAAAVGVSYRGLCERIVNACLKQKGDRK